MMKKNIVWAITILWMTTIFYFSSQPANVSSQQSGTILVKLGLIRENELLDEDNLKVDILQTTIRKLAHFSVYAILGALLTLALLDTKYHPNQYKWAWLTGTLYAVSDEIHQSFVPGRGPMVSDVVIDSLGVLTAVLIVRWMLTRYKGLSKLLY